MANYDNKPSIYEANGDGSYTYRWDIQEIAVPAGTENEESSTKWECEEVVVWGTVTSNKLTDAVINHLWSKDFEQKLINEYNGVALGLFGVETSVEAQNKINAYKDFLNGRNAIKAQIDADCETLNIR